MNGWAIKGPDGTLCMASTEAAAWATHKDDDAEYLKRQGFTCVPVTIQEAAQSSIEQRLRDDVAALGPVEALRRITEPESAQAVSDEDLAMYAGWSADSGIAAYSDIGSMARELIANRAIKTAYKNINPLGGPAVMFDSMAERIRAGDEFYSVLADYGLSLNDHGG